MGQNSKIQWCSHSWNPWHGCEKVSAGCKFCYMYRDKTKYGQNPRIVHRGKTTFRDPFKIKEPSLIFTCSWSDWFIEQADPWREEAWQIIRENPQHTFQILTKRPERIMECLPADWGDGYPNVWLGVSVEDQANADKRIPILLSVPAKIRFISAEPLLGPVDLRMLISIGSLNATNNDSTGMVEWIPGPISKLDWVIIGGESGNETGEYTYRPCRLEWIDSIIRQCDEAGVKVFLKQLGTYLVKKLNLPGDRHGGDPEIWTDKWKRREYPHANKEANQEKV